MKNILTTVSAVALLAFVGAPAMAADSTSSSTSAQMNATAPNNPDTPAMPTVTKDDVKQGWDNTKADVSKAANDTSKAVKNAYEDVKFRMLGDKDQVAQTEPVVINSRVTAKGMIGKSIQNDAGERVATLHDIIIDKSGTAQMVIVSDADFIDVASKHAAFDYSLISQRDKDGDFIAPLTEDNIKQAHKFSYDQKDATKADVRVLPAGAYSVDKLLKAEIVNPAGKKVASVDNISFKGGKADLLVIGYNKVLGIGGDDAALAFNDVKLVRKNNDSFNFQLTQAQADQFEAFKKTTTN